MKKSRFTDSQILAVLKQAEVGTPVSQLCREHGISSATFYKWRSKFDGMAASLMSQLKELQDENRRLKKIYADAQLSAELLKEAMEKNDEAISTPGDGPMGSGERAHEYPARPPDVRTERDRLSLPGQGERGERAHRGLADPADHSLS
jgi:putative transposase